jgi:hypothetical protein
VPTKVATPTPTPPAVQQGLFQTYAQGELLPDMRVPIQRNDDGEGGWYVAIGSEDGWRQFLSQMGQPQEIWQPVSWDKEILIGALLGVRSGRGFAIDISDMIIDGVSVRVMISMAVPTPAQTPAAWITYPFHIIRVPRQELMLGPLTLDFVSADVPGELLVSQEIDTADLNILWLPGEAAVYPTPTALPSTSTPEPTRTPTPVPNLQSIGTVLEIDADKLRMRLLPPQGEWVYVDLMKATSILFEDDQPGTVAQLAPGMQVNVLGYESENGTMRAAHIDVRPLPAETPGFAAYHTRKVPLSTLYDGYSLPVVAQDISLTLPLSQTFSLTQTQALLENGFLVVETDYSDFAALYQDASFAGYPAFVSADAVLHVSQLVYDQVRRTTEQTYLLPELRMLDREMFALSWAQYEAMRGSSTSDEQRIATTALRNAAYFGVALSLLDPSFSVPAVISPVVQAELALITASEVVTTSPLFDLPGVPDAEKQRVDYTRFALARGGAEDGDLVRYRQAVTWHRALAFRVSQREETRSAALIAFMLNEHSAPRILWERVHGTLTFFEGQDASFTPPQYGTLLAAVLPDDAGIRDLADQARMDALTASVQGLPPPDNPLWEIRFRSDRMPERSWRFLSAPFEVDAYVFEQVTGENVGREGNWRVAPSLVDLAAALGSSQSYRIATEMGATEYDRYLDQVSQLRNDLSVLQTTHWTENLHWNWLYAYRTLIEEKSPSYPEWMRTSAWQRRELQAMFGSWTNVHHDAFTETGPSEAETLSATGTIAVPWGYVEPQPQIFARLAAQTRMLIDGLEERLMLTSTDLGLLLDLEAWLDFLQDVARHELTGQALTADEYRRLGEVGAEIQAFGQATFGDRAPGDAVTARVTVSETAQLVQATGTVDTIYVVVERGREQYLARGGVYSHYEFLWPLDDPLTDATWREMLAAGTTPPRAAWVRALMPQ